MRGRTDTNLVHQFVCPKYIIALGAIYPTVGPIVVPENKTLSTHSRETVKTDEPDPRVLCNRLVIAFGTSEAMVCCSAAGTSVVACDNDWEC